MFKRKIMFNGNLRFLKNIIDKSQLARSKTKIKHQNNKKTRYIFNGIARQIY